MNRLGCVFRAQAFQKQCLCQQNRPLNYYYHVFFSPPVRLLNTHTTPFHRNHRVSGTSLHNYPFQPDFICKETILGNNHCGLQQDRLPEVFLYPCLQRIWEYLNSGDEAGDASMICQHHSELSKFQSNSALDATYIHLNTLRLILLPCYRLSHATEN